MRVISLLSFSEFQSRAAALAKSACFALACALMMNVYASAQSKSQIPIEILQEASPEALKQFVPLLPAVKADVWKIDPKVGYAVKNVGGGVYVMSDNGWQSAFLVTEDGVIVLDAPSSYGKSIPAEIAKVTDKPIRMLIYSHAHKDHIGGSAAFKDVKDLQIVALDTVSDFLKEKQDPNRLIPNVTFSSAKTISLGGQTIELTLHGYHSNQGDLFIYIPQAKFLMAIDCVTAGYAPFQGFDITTNFGEYMKVFDQLLAYDFNTFVGSGAGQANTSRDKSLEGSVCRARQGA